MEDKYSNLPYSLSWRNEVPSDIDFVNGYEWYKNKLDEYENKIKLQEIRINKIKNYIKIAGIISNYNPCSSCKNHKNFLDKDCQQCSKYDKWELYEEEK